MRTNARRSVNWIDPALGLILLALLAIALAGCNTLPPYAALHIGWTTIPPASPTPQPVVIDHR